MENKLYLFLLLTLRISCIIMWKITWIIILGIKIFHIYNTFKNKLYTHEFYLQTMTELYSGSILSWSYGSWIYNYICNQCLSSLKLWVWILIRRGVLDTTLCDKVCQWLAAGRWLFLGTLVSSTNKTDCHDITQGSLWAADSRHWCVIIGNATLKEWKRVRPPLKCLKCHIHFGSWAVAAARNWTHLLSVSSEKLFWENPIAGSWLTTISRSYFV